MKKSTEKFTLENYTIIVTVKFGERGELEQGWTAWESDVSDIPGAEEADRAWNASRVPASLHATTRHREGSRRRVVLGGRGERGHEFRQRGRATRELSQALKR